MARYLDLETWKRRQHFHFFRGYDNPYFNLCGNVDVSRLLAHCRKPEGPSFFLVSLYLSLRAANEIEGFRYRLRGERVEVLEKIHGGSTVLRPDKTFGFGYFQYTDDLDEFLREGREILSQVAAGDDLEAARGDDLIHYSVIPWVSFTSFSHARRWGTDDAVPKLVFGKYFLEQQTQQDRWLMPMSVEVHHALLDGHEVGLYFQSFQKLLDEFPNM